MSVSVPFDLEKFKRTPQSIDRLSRYVSEQASIPEHILREECEKKQFFANVSSKSKREAFLLRAIDLLPKRLAQYKALLVLLIAGHPSHPEYGRWSHSMVAQFFKVSIESVKRMEKEAMDMVRERLSQIDASGIYIPGAFETVQI